MKKNRNYDMSSLFVAAFVIVVGIIAFTSISQYIKNENSPVVATKAWLIDKKADVYTSTDANGVTSFNETFYLTFKLDTGSSLKLVVSGIVYRNAVSHDWGTLTFQGTRFLRFESSCGVLER